MLLAVETSGQGFSLALAEADGSALRSVFFGYPLKDKPTASRLLPALDFLVRDAGADKRSISRVAVSAGPGGFTGLRSGLTLGKALAQELGAPLVPVPTLLARALWHLDGDAPANRPIAVAVDARRKQVYGAVYFLMDGQRWQTILPPACVSIAEFSALAAEALERAEAPAPLFCREPEILLGAEDSAAAGWEARCRRGLLAPTALEVAALAFAQGDDLALADPALVEPLYVRPADAKPLSEQPRLFGTLGSGG